MRAEDPRGTGGRRLRRIETQVRGLQRMVEGEAYCVDILHQVAAVRAALAAVGRLLLGRHVERCVADAVLAEPAGGRPEAPGVGACARAASGGLTR